MATTPYMKIKLGDISVEAEWLAHLSSVQVKDSLDSLDSASFTFTLPEGSGAKLVPKIGPLYGKTWSVELVGGKTPRTFSGDITQISWTRSGSAPRSVTITGIDHMHRLKRGRANAKANDRRWYDKKVSEIIQAVAKDWNLGTGDIQSTSAPLKEFEWKKDDASLLKELAEKMNYIVRCDFTGSSPTLVFSRKDKYGSGSPVELEFGLDILDINATHNLDPMVTEVSLAVSDPHKPATIIKSTSAPTTVTALNSSTYLGPALMKDRLGSQFPHHLDIKEKEISTQSEADERTKGHLANVADQFCSGSLTCRFDPDLYCGGKVKVSGAGWPFDGTFISSEVTHSFDGTGYRSQISFFANSIGTP